MAGYDRHHDGNILASHHVVNASPQGRRTWDSAIADDDLNQTPRKRARLNDSGHGDSHPSTRLLKRLSHDAYTVGWVAALPIEMAAAKAMLDDIHQPLAMSPNDSNVYVFGNIGNHNIVIAYLPSGQYGITRAAIVANNMRWSFPSIKVRLMVGIGGGVPDKIDIRLGDIVVSHPSSTSSGVIQYDFGKTVQEGHFQHSGTLNKPPQQLLTAVAKLRADHESRPSRIPEILSEMQDRYSMMTAYTYQGAAQDRLYEATYDHTGRNCDDCNPSYLVKRNRRIGNNPEIHYGIIASANQVMKHGQTRRRLALDHNVLCFEMEAAGLMDSFPCLVIRGICDYSDSHKIKQWQEYAAAAAAAYAKELLSVISPEEIHRSSRADFDTQPSRETISSDHRSRFLDSLKFDEIDSRHSTIKAAHAKTCQWLLKHPDYTRWLDIGELINHHGILWIRGKPGAGKSTIMKYAFSRAGRKTANNTAVISFFFNARGGSLEKSTEGMHRSLLLQLLEKIPELQKVLEDASFATLSGSGSDSWSLPELRDLFSRAVAKLGQRQVTCFIDALDECDESEVRQMLDFFEDLGQNAVQNNIGFYVCFSSRHYPYMDVQYGVRFTLEDQQGHQADLEEYVRSKMKTVTRKQADELTQEILRKASGVFMWVVLVIDILNKDLQRGRIFAVKKRLQEIPPKLSDLFRDILTRDTENMDDLLLSIQWILFAKRPLRLEEYYFALVAGLDPDSLAEWDPEQISEESMNQFMVSSSKGLAEITKSKNATVQFIHESVRDFLLKDNGLTSLWPDLGDNPKGRSHGRLTTCCHSYAKVDVSAYVQSDDYFLEERKDSAKVRRTQVTEKFPFLEYATNQLLYHSDTAECLGISQRPFLQDFLGSLDNWIIHNNLFQQHKIRRYNPRTSPLYIFADAGFEFLAEIMIREESQLPNDSSADQRFKTPLHAAVNWGHARVVALFLRYVTVDEINRPLRKNETPLFTAVEKKHADIVEMLLEAGADPNPQGSGPGVDLLSLAIDHEQDDIIELLLCRDFSIKNFQDLKPPVNSSVVEAKTTPQARVRLEIDLAQYGKDVLHRATRKRLSRTVRLLLAKGADANFIPENANSSLYEAVQNADEHCTKVLLQGGADVNISSFDYDTPFRRAIRDGEDSICNLLLDNSREPDRFRDKPTGMTWLHLAISSENRSIVSQLLQKKASLTIKDNRGHTALHIAAQKGCLEVAKQLVDLGADIDCTDLQGRTPLFLACEKQNFATAAFLFNQGASFQPTDISNSTPSYKEGAHKHIEKLLQLGADNINERDDIGQTPLFEACHLGSLDIARLLLERGAGATVIDNQGQTALFAIQRSHVHSGRLVRLLVEAGADPMHKNAQGQRFLDASYGFPKLPEGSMEAVFKRIRERRLDEGHGSFERTALAQAGIDGNAPLFAFLLYLGANPNKKDFYGDTILHTVARLTGGVYNHMACLLLDAGADATRIDKRNKIPLDIARIYGRDSLVEILRSRLRRTPSTQSGLRESSG